MKPSGVGRRQFLRYSAGGAGATLLVPATAVLGARAAAVPQFAHGVASGDPRPGSVLLWTRVTPSPEATPGSGAGPVVDVRWEVARDSGFAAVVASGTVAAGPASDHTVKVDVAGLAPATTYWFRFTLDGVRSPSGRTRTAPAVTADLRRLRFGLVSCSNWQAGYFAAYRHLAARGDLDLVVHVGDYLYEYQAGTFTAGGKTVRTHDPANEIVTLADYRRRHAQYKSDPDLQSLHAQVPWAITWDDHETANDAWSGGAENHQPATEGSWAARRAAARQAYLEWMPVNPGPGGTIYRGFRFGRLADLNLLDLRTYRSQQVSATDGPALDDPARTITGDGQMTWLKDAVAGTAARWKLVGNPVMISPVGIDLVRNDLKLPLAELLGVSVDGVPVNADSWDGYTADRHELLGHLHENRITNTVFLTGDIHSSWACDVPLDAAAYPGSSPSVAAELVGTSVTSDNVDDLLKVPPRTASLVAEAAVHALNRHVKYVELDSHGFSVVDVTPERVQMDWWYLTDRTSKTSGARRAASFVVPSGTQSVRRVLTGI